MRRVTFGISFLLLFFLFVPVQGEAAAGDTYEVSNGMLHVREAPSINAEIIGMLYSGDTVTTFDEQYGWVMTYYGGQKVWVAKHHLSPVSQSQQSSSEPQAETIRVTADSVHLRSGPGTGYSSLGGAVAGDTYSLLNTDGDWHQISLNNGETAWIAAWLTDAASTGRGEEPSASAVDTSNNEEPSETVTEPVQTTDPGTNEASGSLSGYTIVLDAGHGGIDPGAIGLNNVYEKDLVYSTTEKVAAQLLQTGANVVMTRSGDYFVPLEERTHISNTQRADAFISLHYNAFPILSVNGFNTFYTDNADRGLAQNIHFSISQEVSLHDRGFVQADYHVLRNTSAPSVLLELGFITNPGDLSQVQSADYQYQVADAIVAGLKKYFHN
ncbi:N-acetylmuramoyl-L-alanine amidase [Lentibacillus sediminis]|uniref:N-acetylmuramoyl-L-alanine amidase n=1 Tax=Lentibacillus sediminis TaxID=1940529 RepID=UPI000C1C1506|nr:N-acetylmuramoyl-L-alanine amidase [Lentibacillus sediminis]